MYWLQIIFLKIRISYSNITASNNISGVYILALIEKQLRILRQDSIKKRKGEGKKGKKEDKTKKGVRAFKGEKYLKFVSYFMNSYHIWRRGWGRRSEK